MIPERAVLSVRAAAGSISPRSASITRWASWTAISGELTENTDREGLTLMGVKAAELIKLLMSMGQPATVNQSIDFETAAILAQELGHEVVNVAFDESEHLIKTEDEGVDLPERPPVVTVMDTSRVIARVHISQADALEVTVGNDATLIGGNGVPVSAKVTQVAPALDTANTTVEVWIEADNKDGKLRPGASLRVEMVAAIAPVAQWKVGVDADEVDGRRRPDDIQRKSHLGAAGEHMRAVLRPVGGI